jgi:hypothetical protein
VAETITDALERNLRILEAAREQAQGLEADLDRTAIAASRVGDGIAEGLGRLTTEPAGPPPVPPAGGGRMLFDASGQPVLSLGALPSRSGGAGGAGGSGGSSRLRIAGTPGVAGSEAVASGFGPGAPVSGGPGGGAGGGGSSFERVVESARGTTQAVRTLDSRSSQLQAAMLGQLTAIRERLERSVDLGLLSRSD